MTPVTHATNSRISQPYSRVELLTLSALASILFAIFKEDALKREASN